MPSSFAVLLFVACQLISLPVAAAERLHVIVIGNNRPNHAAGSSVPAPLRYADDDAAAVYEFFEPVADSRYLLTLFDQETETLYPEAAQNTRLPTSSALRAAVTELGQRLEQTRAAGTQQRVILFFSGHGVLDYGGTPALLLLDGGLTQRMLYDEVLGALPADSVHLLIDACHAEAVVRPRNAEGQVVEISSEQADAFAIGSTLARFPHVGFILGATTQREAHEWNAIRHGIFTHELLSALRGGADVNRDRRIEYSEAYAFMSAANRNVADARAKPSLLAKPPETNRRSVLADLTQLASPAVTLLEGVPGGNPIEIEDARGRRLVTLHGDQEFQTDLVLPASALLYVRRGLREARFDPASHARVAFDSLRFDPIEQHSRGALADALHAGLFAAQYGKRYYEGLIDRASEFLPVPFAVGEEPPRALQLGSAPLGAGNPALVFGAGLSDAIADALAVTHGVTIGIRPRVENGLSLSLRASTASDRSLSEWRGSADAGWLWAVLESGPVSTWVGGGISVGGIVQDVRAREKRSTFAAGAGPVVGLTTKLTRAFGIWSELSVLALMYRRDEKTVMAPQPSAWLGGSLEL